MSSCEDVYAEENAECSICYERIQIDNPKGYGCATLNPEGCVAVCCPTFFMRLALLIGSKTILPPYADMISSILVV